MTELEEKQARENYQQMRLIDNELMDIAFQNNKEAVEYVIQIILNKKDLTVTELELQKVQALPNNHKSVILDIYAKDREGKVYNVELQTNPYLATGLRARYHFCAMDGNILNKGDDFSLLPETYVIFITDGPFLYLGKDVPIEFYVRKGIYTDTKLEDKQTVVFVNAKCTEGDTELAQLMKDLTARSTDKIVSNVLKSAVHYAKGPKGEDMYIEGYVKNQDEVWNAATKEATLATQKADIRSCFKNNISIEQLSKIFDFSENEIQAILDED